MNVSNTIFNIPKHIQTKNQILRNLFFSLKEHRVLYVDRFLNNNHTEGIIYLMQTNFFKYSSYGTYIWDVTDKRNLEMVGNILDIYHQQSLNALKGNIKNHIRTLK